MKGITFFVHLIFVYISGIFQRFCHHLFALYHHPWRSLHLPPITDDILLIPACELAKKILKREVRSETVVAAYITRLREINPLINAVCAARYELALEEAREVDTKLDGQVKENISNEDWPPLFGVPITVKEALAVNGFQQTGGFKSRIGFIAQRDAAAVAKLKDAGAIILATTNTSELCMWWESHNHVYGVTRNPYNLAAIAGGSSGGEGAAVGGGGSLLGLGSDIGGSIRMPSFFCGVFGHKATTGIVESAGQFPECDSPNEWYMVSQGPICRYASDLPLFLSILVKPSLAAELRLNDPVNLSKLKYFSLEEWGPKAHFTDAVDEELVNVQKVIAKAWLGEVGTSVESLSVPEFFYQFSMWAGMICENGSSSHTFSQLMAGGPPQDLNPFKEFVQWLQNRSTHTLPTISVGLFERFLHIQGEETRKQAAKCRLLKDKLAEILGDNGVIFAPVHPKVGYYHHETLLHVGNFSYTGIWNCFGFPATAVPLGLGEKGLPLGIQVISNFNNDRYCLAVAKKLEELFGGWVPPPSK